MPTPTDLEVSGWIRPDADTWILHFIWTTNPIPMNGSRGHFRTHAKKVRVVRDTTHYRVLQAGIPALGRVRAQVTWWVQTNRTRDTDNLAGVEKPMFDALVSACVVSDDKPALMSKPRGRIRHISERPDLVTKPGFTLTITRLDIDDEREFE